jgi:hypothetical protein
MGRIRTDTARCLSQRTKKTVRPRTAGLIAAAYARKQGISPEDAFKRLFVQDEEPPA